MNNGGVFTVAVEGAGKRTCLALTLVFLSLLQVAATPEAGPPATVGTASEALAECEDYASELLERHLRICDGTPWPEQTEKFLMPLMEANRDRFQGKTVLDIGTGCGLLAFYAAQLGAARVVATDLEPAAIACVRENARRLGLESIVEARLVSAEDPSAYAVIRPDESFDIIVGFPPGYVERGPFAVSPPPGPAGSAPTTAPLAVNEVVPPNDTIELGFSILDGLGAHLRQDGAALLCYRFAALHTLLVKYAAHLGYRVEHHPALQISPPDWSTLYNTFAVQVARDEGLEPEPLLMPSLSFAPEAVAAGALGSSHSDSQLPRGALVRGLGPAGTPHVVRLHAPAGPLVPYFTKSSLSTERGLVFSRLWDRELDRILPGAIVVRRGAAGAGRPEGTAPRKRQQVAPEATRPPPLAAQATASATSDGCFEHFSELLGGSIRICQGTPWPMAKETELMPLMTARREKFQGKTVLELRTGSGLLAFYAARLGAAKVVATDVSAGAVACARENARRLGLDSLVETRLATGTGPEAYAAVQPGEAFDVVISAPPFVVNRFPAAKAGAVDPGIPPDDHVRLALSLVKGLQAHLKPDGAAVLLYQSALLHELVLGCAWQLGFLVEHHPPLSLADADWRVLYNTLAGQVALTKSLDPEVLLLPRADGGLGTPSSFVKPDYLAGAQREFAPLWDGGSAYVTPGLIVLRKPAMSPVGPRPH